jgi:hypothetical protein
MFRRASGKSTMSTVVTTLQRLFFRSAARRPTKVAVRKRAVRGVGHPDFTDTRPVVFRSEAFAEDLRLTHGVV